MNFKSLKEAFQVINRNAIPDLSVKEKTLLRTLVIKYSCGKNNLQRGSYATIDDIEKRKAKICTYNFSN
jgi:hypothetical protein